LPSKCSNPEKDCLNEEILQGLEEAPAGRHFSIAPGVIPGFWNLVENISLQLESYFWVDLLSFESAFDLVGFGFLFFPETLGYFFNCRAIAQIQKKIV